ncbi:MAG: amidohydrolase [Gammaproteobacteria bacterium]|nr:amidohydrolase [Gammaproteobacteria bacterium]
MRDLSALPDLRLALLQGPLVWHDVPANLHYFSQLLAGLEPVDLVLLPEMFNTGFSMDSASQAEAEMGPTTQWLLQQAQCLNAVVCGSLIIKVAEHDYRNRLIWARPDGSLAHYDKRHLFRMAGEHKYFCAGEQQLQVELKGWRIRPLICYDLRFPVWSRDAQNTDLLFYLASWPAARRAAWNRLLPARAIENLCYVAAVNRTGTDHQGYTYSGDSQVLDFMGETLLDAADQEGAFYVSLSAGKLAEFKQKFPAYLDADPFVFAPPLSKQ